MNKIPYFSFCEETGKYTARRKLTDAQIMKAARKLIEQRMRPGRSLSDPFSVKIHLVTNYADYKREVFICLFADNRNCLIKSEIMFEGTIDQAAVYPREIARRSIELNAAAVIFAHNHPSGNCKPSLADILMTENLVKALSLIGVKVLDHMVIGGADIFSFAEKGFLGTSN